MNWKQKVEGFLNNQELLLDIRSGLILVVSIALPMFYFLYSQNFSISGLLNFEFGVLSLFVIMGNILTFFEISEKAQRDEFLINPAIKEEELNTAKAQATLPKKIDTLIAFNKFYNKEKQDNRNKKLTNDRIAYLNNKITNAKINDKPYEKYETEIAFLEINPLFDKTYKPVELKRVITQENKTDNQIEGNDAIYINPKTYGVRRFLIKQIFKSLGIGGSGMFILGINESGWTIFTFYIIYIISLLILVAFRYPNVRKVTKTLYLATLKNKQQYIKEYHEWNGTIEEKEKEEE